MTFLTAATSSSLNAVEPGVLGFLVVAGIGVALVFLLRSMSKQIKKIPPPEEPQDQEAPAGDGTAEAGHGTAEAEGAKRG